MVFSSYQKWTNTICLKVLHPDYIEEIDVCLVDGAITHRSKRPYLADSTPEIYAECYEELGYKRVADMTEYVAEIAAMEGQEQLTAEHIEEIERSHVA